jgi:large subunit ribosomal protein L13
MMVERALTKRNRHASLNWEEYLVSTYMANPQTVERKWFVIDAEDMVLGRLASQVASILRGKNKPTFTPHCDCGDHVIIVNASKIKLTGKKLDQKMYYYHTGYPGGLKEVPYRKLMANKSEFAFREAVRRMLPKGPLGYKTLKKLHVYAGPEHEQQAQKPEILVLK